MLTMDIFNNNAFSAVSLSTAIDLMDYVPNALNDMPGLFDVEPVRTEVIWIEKRAFSPQILPFSPRGSAPKQESGDQRDARAYKTLRFADASRITASELLAIRAFGSEVALKDVQSEVARRQMKIKQSFTLTREFHKFNCVTGAVVKDSDGTTLIDWASEFGAIPAELDFDLDNASPAEGALRQKCTTVRRSVLVNLKGIGAPREIVGICGDTFWDQITSHPEVVKTYLNWGAAADLRNGYGAEWSSFRYGQITFANYRGTDDGSTLGMTTTQCKFFPVGAGIFKWAMSPGEQFDHIGTLGQDTYSMMVVDRDRNSWSDVEAYSYPLPVCIRPQALHRARNT